jgi:hypothetical protein
LYYFIIWFDAHWIDIQSVWWCVLINIQRIVAFFLNW